MSLTYDYYDLKVLARQVRARYGLKSLRILPYDLHRIYSQEGIEIDYWPYPLKTLRGVFMWDDFGATVMLASNLPIDPLVFTMAHELKHFLTDRDLGLSYCDRSNINKRIEIGAEIFAEELLFPDQYFVRYMQNMNITRERCDAKTLVRLKLETKTTLSYAGLAIKAERLRYAAANSLTRVTGWRKLEKVYRETRIQRMQ
jgi:Zn-dependent peptidase ImmA (M78 family)